MDNQTNKFLTMTASPHIKSPIKTKNIMADVIIALSISLVWAIYVFGFRETLDFLLNHKAIFLKLF